VGLAFPFQVERLPRDPENYWLDLCIQRAQFESRFSLLKRSKTRKTGEAMRHISAP
jgi:hypothetical protein